MDTQVLVNKAKELKSEGKLQQPLACYNDVFDLLTKEADEYARNVKGAIIDVGKVRAMTPKLFEEAIELTPDGEDYPDSKIGLRKLKK